MRSRLAVWCVLLTAAVSGLLFAPVFGFVPLLVPIAAVLLSSVLVAEVCARLPVLRPWRPLLALVAGLVAVIETELRDTTETGLPTGETWRALAGGAVHSWQLTLQSTWPARPDAELLLFVPLAVLLTAVLAVELLRWTPAALVPGLVLLGVSQAYVALTGPLGTVAGLAYAALSATLFVLRRPYSVSARQVTALALVVPVLLGTAGAVVVTVLDQGNRPSLSARTGREVPLPPTRVTNPLDEVAARLKQPENPVFSYTSPDRVDRWRLAVLDEFDGANWFPDDDYRRMGTRLDPAPGVTAPTTVHSAQIQASTVDTPWLPSQATPAEVTGAAPLIAPASGMLLSQEPAGPVGYRLSWREPDVDARKLADAPIDSTVPARGLGAVPPGIGELARTAVGGLRPSFQAAFVLERYLSTHYHVATGPGLPTGSGWPQLGNFLLRTQRGTSEQFAASYVALARIVGIPARIAVGFRAPAAPPGTPVVVRDGDVLAWPEVAVAGVGWVPLDPSGTAAGPGGAPGASPTGLAAATAQARAELPPTRDLKDPQLPPSDQDTGDTGAMNLPLAQLIVPVLLGLLALLVLGVAGLPVVKTWRGYRRRRRTGADGVIAAWWEARDLVRAHGVSCPAGTTVRELSVAASATLDRTVVDGLVWLASQVDIALWSGNGADGGTLNQAWGAVDAIRRSLAERSRRQRVRAAFDPRCLFPPREVVAVA
ncbi:transglutaminaseTgpA domain-containing protein [Amycolatopsis sp. NPDC059027]|uniref:transglutaminase family protein n=1 Tax=Amycolatopsis sp. NPDC059027 TaxID=3346709 RepID=UPI003673353A